MRILLTNDDGIFAPGLDVLERIARRFSDDIWIVAPSEEQSGAGHSLTLNRPIRVRELGPRRFAVAGTPTDSVMMALGHLMDGLKPDLILSGVNRGPNLAEDLTYSGTMSAAMEGAIEGIPSVGFSLLNYSLDADFSGAAHVARIVASRVLEKGLPQGSLLNVNIPSLPLEDLKGIKICRQAMAKWEEEFDERIDPTRRKYYWLTGKFVNHDRGEDTDEWALANGYVSVVPVQFDFTAHHAIPFLNEQGYELNKIAR